MVSCCGCYGLQSVV